MATITVNSHQMAAALRKLKNVENIAIAMRPEIGGIANALLDEAQEQPTKKPGAFTQYATPGQRRAYWAKVGRGEAQHGPNGYVRSGTLRRGWQQTPVRVTPTRIQFGIENKEARAPFVQGPRQQPFHRASNWKTDKRIATERRRIVVGRVDAAIKRIIAK